MKNLWEIFFYSLVICTAILCIYLGYALDKAYKDKPNPCPTTKEKLVSIHIDGNKTTCVYLKEPLGLKRKYYKEMWE